MKTTRSAILLGLALSASLFAGAGQAAAIKHDASWYGAAVPAQASARTIVVTPQTRWVNVTNGETVTFAVGDQRFTFQFQTYPQTQVTDLRTIAPAGIEVAPVRVYVADNNEGRG